MNDQQTLLEKILASTLSIDPGIAIYQRNRWAMAERALSISFPTVYQLLDEGFSTLVRKFLLTHPNSHADWGNWGEKFPAFIKTTPLETELPYLSDCASLDWHIHVVERNNNSVMDASSFALLENTNPEIIHLALNENIAFIKSNYPLYAIWKMHQPDENFSHWKEIAREHLYKTPNNTEHLIIFRTDWKATPLPVIENEYIFMQQLRNRKSLSIALDALANTDFNFTEWLLCAVKCHWISSIFLHNPINHTGDNHE